MFYLYLKLEFDINRINYHSTRMIPFYIDYLIRVNLIEQKNVSICTRLSISWRTEMTTPT